MLNLFGETMKRLLLLTVFFLTACGPSQEEKQQIATIACNVMAESTTMDGAMKIKEVNQAREQIGEPPFLSNSNMIQESIKYNFCESLVLNDPKYSEMLALKKYELKDDLSNFVEGIWLYFSDEQVQAAEFVRESIIFTNYGDEEEFNYSDQFIHKYEVLDNGRLRVQRAGNSETYIIGVNQATDQITVGDKIFNRAAFLTNADIQGNWLEFTDRGSEGEAYWLSTDTRYEILEINHEVKNFSKQIDECIREIHKGFIFIERCAPTEKFPEPSSSRWFVKNYDNEANKMVHFSPYESGSYEWEDVRVSDNYTLPSPPKGYTDVSEK